MCPCTLVIVFLGHLAHVVEVVVDVVFLVHLAHVVIDVVVGVVLRELSMIASVAPRHCSHKARYMYVEVVGVRKLQLDHFS
jgi:type III secretory pathway component EscR